MEKAILVMEMPKSCDDCYLCVEYGGCCRCVTTGEVMAKPHEVKPDECPLIPMPAKQSYSDLDEDADEGGRIESVMRKLQSRKPTESGRG